MQEIHAERFGQRLTDSTLDVIFGNPFQINPPPSPRSPRLLWLPKASSSVLEDSQGIQQQWSWKPSPIRSSMTSGSPSAFSQIRSIQIQHTIFPSMYGTAEMWMRYTRWSVS